MNKLISKIINEIKDYAKEQDMAESDALSLVIGNLINISAMSYIEPIIVKEKE